MDKKQLSLLVIRENPWWADLNYQIPELEYQKRKIFPKLEQALQTRIQDLRPFYL